MRNSRDVADRRSFVASTIERLEDITRCDLRHKLKVIFVGYTKGQFGHDMETIYKSGKAIRYKSGTTLRVRVCSAAFAKNNCIVALETKPATVVKCADFTGVMNSFAARTMRLMAGV